MEKETPNGNVKFPGLRGHPGITTIYLTQVNGTRTNSVLQILKKTHTKIIVNKNWQPGRWWMNWMTMSLK